MSEKYYIGIMSGTSMDAIDCIVVNVKTNSIATIASKSFPYPPTIKRQIQQIYQHNYQLSLETLGCLDLALGKLYAQCVNELLSLNQLSSQKIIAIGCHGQTLYHQPKSHNGFSIQLGRGDVIAQLTNIDTVNDFRNKDILNNGQGAPLVPAFHQAFFSHPVLDRVIVNLGGIANISCLSANKPLIGFDTGPANTLIDQWIWQHKNMPYDKNGNWGRQGVIIEALLARMLKDAYFKKPYPKSTGLEYFNLKWLQQFNIHNYQPQDVQATLHALTAKSIAEAILSIQPSCKEIYLCGGGAKNDLLISLLNQYSHNISLFQSNQLGIDEQWVEASAFAWLAYCHINKIKLDLHTITGAHKPSLLGTLHHP